MEMHEKDTDKTEMVGRRCECEAEGNLIQT